MSLEYVYSFLKVGGGEGVSIIIIRFMSIDVFISSKGRREVVIALSPWFTFMLWNNNDFWFHDALVW